MLDKDEQEIWIAPVYDCGSALSPLISDNELSISDSLCNILAMSVTSAIRKESGEKILYSDYLLSGENPDVNTALQKVVPLIDLQAIKQMIDEIPYISDVRKSFYNNLLTERYNRVLLPSLENILNIKKNTEYKQWNSKTIANIYDKYIAPFGNCSKFGNIVFVLKNGKSEKFGYIKNGDYVFFMQNDVCKGMVSVVKSNLNVCKFVQFARNIGIDIDKEITVILRAKSFDAFKKDDF